jgi:hypothetical protein
MFKDIKVFFEFFRKKYLEKIKKLDQKIDFGHVVKVLDTTTPYLKGFGSIHCPRIDDIIARLESSYPLKISEKVLPKNLLGVFIPSNEKNNIGRIVLNTRHDRDMHISTIGHEYGHLMLHFYNYLTNKTQYLQPQPIQARASCLMEPLETPSELLADYIMVVGTYPIKGFKESFCNAQGKVKGIYQFTPILFIRALFYLAKHFPHLRWSFFRSDNKLYHLSLVLHCIRLRIFVYEKGGI